MRLSRLPTPSDPMARWAGGRYTVILMLALCLAPAPLAARTVDRIVAVVNTEVITLSELHAEIEADQERLRGRYRGEELQRRLQQLEYAGLTRMIERRLQMQLARTKGFEVSDDEVRQAIRELQRQGERVNEADPAEQRHVREQLVLLKLQDREVRSGIMVTEAELQRYFESHLNRFALPAEYRLSQIFLRRRSDDDGAELQRRAAALAEALKHGADFAELALRQSEGAESARGGSLGYIRQGELLPQIERAVASLEPGQVSDPIETPQGWHIIRLDEKKPPQFRPFAEVRNEIQTLVFQQKTEDIYRLWLADLKNKSHIEVRF